MTAPIERPDWGGGTELIPSSEDRVVPSAEPASAFAGPEVEQRYRAMVAKRMAKASLPADEARGALDAVLVAEWEASGGFATRLAQAQKGAIAILERLDPDDRGEFTAAFDALPEGVRSALLSEISLGSSGSARNASDADVTRFASTPEGAELVNEWGYRANRNVAIIRDRVSRILGRMEAEDIDAATAWFDALPPSHAAAIYRMLVAK
jgi:hypothetical protein